jgi:hypothetical protein
VRDLASWPSRLHTSSSRSKSGIVAICVASFLAIVVGVLVTDPNYVRIALVIALLPLVVAIATLSPGSLIIGLAGWLAVLGTVRRLFPSQGGKVLADPLLFVGPFVLLILILTAVGKKPHRDRSKLAKAVFYLCLLAAVEALNPLQGGITVGLGGFVLVLIPMLAFWVGRSLLDGRTMTRLLRVLAGLAVAAACYGLIQTSIGFPSWDVRWLASVQQTYHALSVGGVTRAFGSFSSSQEYAAFLGIGIAVWLGFAFRSKALFFCLAFVVLIGWAVLLESSRGVLVLAVIALGVMIAVRADLSPVGTIIGGLLAFIALSYVSGHLATPGGATGAATGTTSALLSHQFNGIANPLNTQDSTLTGHFNELVHGLKSAFGVPIGHGIGSITLAAAKFGGTSANTETDLSNAGVAFGLVGMILYVVILFRGIGMSYRLARLRSDPVSLAVLGVLIVTLFQWLNGGLYAVIWLPWLFLGWIDRQWMDEDEKASRIVAAVGEGRRNVASMSPTPKPAP